MYIYVHLYGFPKWVSGKESACQCRRHGFDPYIRRSHGVGSGNPLQYSYWNNPTDRGASQRDRPLNEHTCASTYIHVYRCMHVCLYVPYMHKRVGREIQ